MSKNKARDAWRLIEAARSLAEKFDREQNTCQFGNRLEEVQTYSGDELSDDFDAEVVAVGNWNTLDEYDRVKRERVDLPGGDLPKRLGDALERIGVELDWTDCTTTCDECNKLLNTNPTHYGWQPSYVSGDGFLTCEECIDPAEYLESLEGDGRKALNISSIDPTEHGYTAMQEDFQRGFHRGQDADPCIIAKALEKRGIKRFLFRIDDIGQFDVRFSVYVHEDDENFDLVEDGEQLPDSECDGPSVSAAMERGLREGSLAADKLQGDGIRVVTVTPEGATAKIISRDEFIVHGLKGDPNG
jgi:hypothetical protein